MTSLSEEIIEEELSDDERMVIDFSSGVGHIAKVSVVKTKNVKEKVQNAQRRLRNCVIVKYGINRFTKNKMLEELDKIFKEEFGSKLI